MHKFGCTSLDAQIWMQIFMHKFEPLAASPPLVNKGRNYDQIYSGLDTPCQFNSFLGELSLETHSPFVSQYIMINLFAQIYLEIK